MRKRILILLLLTLMLPACQRTRKTPTEGSALAIKPIRAVDKNISIDDPDGDKIEITPQTKLYFDSIQKSDWEANSFKSYQNPYCIARMKEEIDRWGEFGSSTIVVGDSHYVADAIVLAKVNGFVEHEYCENGILGKYESHTGMKVEILHTLFGSVEKGPKEIIVFQNNYFLPGHTYMILLQKTEYGDYLYSWFFQFGFKKRTFDYDPDISFPYIPCQLVDLPTTVGGLEEKFKEINKPGYHEKYNRAIKLAREHEWIKENVSQSHGEPGEPCNIEEDNRREHEKYVKWNQEQEKERKEIEEYTAGKKVPCDTCPFGYEVEDLEADEYFKRLHEIEKIIEERKKKKDK